MFSQRKNVSNLLKGQGYQESGFSVLYIIIVVTILWSLSFCPLLSVRGSGLHEGALKEFQYPAAPTNGEIGGLPLAIGEWSPYTGETLLDHGYASRVVSMAFRASGLVPVYHFFPWNRCEYLVKKGEFFATFPYLKIPEREKDFLFSDPLFVSSVRILRYGPNQRTASFVYDGRPISLRPFRVGTTEGTNAVIYPLKAAGVAVEASRTLDMAVKKLAAGRLDFVVEEEETLRDSLRRLFPHDISSFDFLTTPFLAQQEYRLMVSKRYPGADNFLDRFNEGLRKIKAPLLK
ncbi:MAG: transporter substrate-binding domain-containing protein [Treponemataceae bacterium]|nr:transporter substrate-binding domain-containing protein [Treponemataceae bacterium]